MEKRIIGLGVGAGLLAGLASFGYARLQAAPLIAGAIDYEDARSHAESSLSGGHSHEHEVFTRSVQENLGAGVGTVGFAVVSGVLFAVALTLALAVLRRHRVSADPRGVAAVLGCGIFVSACVVPWIVYPATPPGVGQADTVGGRTTAYLTLLIASLIVAAVAAMTALYLRPKWGGWPAAVSAAAGYTVAISAVMAALPTFHETPGPIQDLDGNVKFDGFPADLLADFRVTTLVGQAVLWFVVVGSFAVMLPRIVPPGRVTATEVANAHR